MGKLTVTFLAAIAIVGSSAAQAAASPPQDVSLVVQTTFDALPDDITFAGGAAAPDCVGGTVEDTFFKATPSLFSFPLKSGHTNLCVGKVFHCSDGDINVMLTVVLDFSTFRTVGSWVITGGTGDYSRLYGTGSIVGSPFPGGVEDTYVGKVHSD